MIQPIPRKRQHSVEVFLNGKHIDTVFGYDKNDTLEEIKMSLVDHDNYHPNIRVRRRYF